MTTGSSSPTTTSPSLTKAEQKTGKIWDFFADGYSKSPIKDEDSYQKKLAITREFLKPQSNTLEFGCGTGGTALLHAPFVKNILAIDISPRMIEIAQEKAKAAKVDNVQFECAGIDSFQRERVKIQESFDAILGMSILHLLPNKDEVIQEVFQNLKPGGYFISSTMCLGDSSMMLAWVIAPFSWLGIAPTINSFSKQELLKSMENAGFHIEREFHLAKDKPVFLVAKKPS